MTGIGTDLATLRSKIVAALNLSPLVPPQTDVETDNVVNEAWSALSDLMRHAIDAEAKITRLRQQVERLSNDATGELMQELEKGYILESTHLTIVGGMEAEIARLRQERDALKEECADWERGADEELARAWKERAEAAESELATATTTMELAIRQLEAAERELARLRQECKDAPNDIDVFIERALAAERERNEVLDQCKTQAARLLAAERELASCQQTLVKALRNSEGLEREVSDLKYQLFEAKEWRDEVHRLQEGLRELHTEVDCRIEHGAESGGHLDYVRGKLRALLAENGAARPEDTPFTAPAVQSHERGLFERRKDGAA